MIPDAYPDRRRWQELKEACREAAGYQCQYVYPNRKRCSMRHGELQTSHRGLRYIVYLHSCHLNEDPGNEHPELICLCAKHHMMLDRQAEQRERISQRRRGYQITTTDLLLQEVCTAGVIITGQSDGYSWRIDGYPDLTGVVLPPSTLSAPLSTTCAVSSSRNTVGTPDTSAFCSTSEERPCSADHVKRNEYSYRIMFVMSMMR